MSNAPKHTNNVPECPLCEFKLLQANPILVEWFKNKVKPQWREAHISWSYRNKQEQEKAFFDGATALRYPNSAHNKYDDKGVPSSRALDLFELDMHGMACWSWGFFRDIANKAKMDNEPIVWGGDWKTKLGSALGDSDHFELKKTDTNQSLKVDE